jgi:hypothetical protein
MRLALLKAGCDDFITLGKLCLLQCLLQYFFPVVFFIEQLPLGPMGMPLYDFKFRWMLVELFVFVNDSPVYHRRKVMAPWCIHHPGVVTPRCIHHQWVETPPVYISPESCSRHQGVIWPNFYKFATMHKHSHNWLWATGTTYWHEIYVW